MFIKKDFISRLCTIEEVLRVKKLEGKKVKNE